MRSNNFILICVISIIIIIISIIIDYNKNDESDESIEQYDGKISGLTLNECGTECTTAQNCYGFAYKPVEKQCYLSNKGILGQPETSLYGDEYSKLDRRCNKMNRIKDDDFVDDKSITRNSVYICADGENNVATQFQYANFGASSLDAPYGYRLDNSPDYLEPTVVTYKLHIIDWPTEKKDLEPVGLESYNVNVPPREFPPKPTNTYGFVESDKEFLGQYILAHQCVANVPLYECLKYCEDNPNCSGTEWNYSLLKVEDGQKNYVYEKVCCPKGIIKKVIPRRDKVSRGKYYVKQKLDDMTARNRVIVSKADFKNDQNIPTNKMFVLSDSNPQNQDIDKLLSLPGLIENAST